MWCLVIRSAAPVTQNHLSKPENLMLQNATPLRKSAPWPPNISDKHVSCTTPATWHASFQILIKCPTPAIVFENATKLPPPQFCSLLARCRIPCACHTKTTSEPSKVVRACGGFDLLTWKRASRDNGMHFFNISTSEVLRTWCALHILTPKSASSHNGLHFSDMSTSKSGPNVRCFLHFDLDMCFAPQPRTLFQHLNFQKCSEPGVLCAFWLRNVLRAKIACTFSSLISPDGSAPTTLASLLVDPPEPQIIGKTQCFATLLPFRAPASSVFWLYLFSDLLSSSLLFSDSSRLCFSICPILSEVWLLNFLRFYRITLHMLHIQKHVWRSTRVLESVPVLLKT